jgi:hypothetical protein
MIAIMRALTSPVVEFTAEFTVEWASHRWSLVGRSSILRVCFWKVALIHRLFFLSFLAAMSEKLSSVLLFLHVLSALPQA